MPVRLGLFVLALRLSQVALGESQLGLVELRVDLEQHIVLLDRAAFLEVESQQIPRHAGADLHGLVRFQTAGKLLEVEDVARHRRADVDLRRSFGAAGLRRRMRAAAGQPHAGQHAKQAAHPDVFHVLLLASLLRLRRRSESLRIP